MSVITPLPDPPQTSDPSTFDVKADAWVAALNNMVTELNAFSASVSPTGRNLLINGGMVVDQRHHGATFTPTTTKYSVDRWSAGMSVASKYSIGQNAGAVTPPAGFSKYLGITSLSAYSVGSSDYFPIGQGIEGFNAAQLAWGTANAKTVSLSFYVYSSLTGTFGGSLRNGAGTRSYVFTYNIPTPNVWTLITINGIPGDVTGSWSTDQTAGILLSFSMGAGSGFQNAAGSWAGGNYIAASGCVNVVSTNSATWYVTGVQLEAAAEATPFENRTISREIADCQRYFNPICDFNTNDPCGFGLGLVKSGAVCLFVIRLPVPMRVPPTAAFNLSAANYGVASSSPGQGDQQSICSAVNVVSANFDNVVVTMTPNSPVTFNPGQACWAFVVTPATQATITCDAEFY